MFDEERVPHSGDLLTKNPGLHRDGSTERFNSISAVGNEAEDYLGSKVAAQLAELR